ncbi:ferritin-like domain-containing protein [Ramlibacter sp.]|uniref:ferritin-like domain-containing protein n=1 Tax=Ramlibacter sp. TaxID=1917967 RepID=UPI002C278FEC|nr:ferritin-like domain-containing protein [Ramlibacter sp.]HWI82252.1 ferritin-like domain-containing protein [Ramlibacter sp.]
MTSKLIVPSSDLMLAGRRTFVASGMLSAAAVALLGGQDALAAKSKAGAQGDVDILNAALGAELQAIAAYQVGAESGLLSAGVKPVALEFQGHHKAHADVLAGTVRKLGGRPVAAKPKYDFPLQQLKNQSDVLQFAAGLEKGAVSAYLAAVPRFADRALSQAAASILGDEAMHWAVLRQVLGERPVPSAFVG